MKNDNSFIHKRGTRWQERAHTSKDLHHIDERWGAYHKGVQSQSGRLVLREGKNELTRAGTCTTETRWSCDERSSSGQRQDLRLCYLREQNLGNRECHVKEQQAVTRLGLEEEMLSGQAQERYWIIWPKVAVLYTRRSWKSDIANTCQHRKRLSDESIWELSWSFGRPQVDTVVIVLFLGRGEKYHFLYKVNRLPTVFQPTDAW